VGYNIPFRKRVIVSRGALDILKIFWRFRAKAALGILCLLVVDAAQLAIPLVVKGVVDGLVGSTITRAWVGRQALILLGLAAAIAVFRFAWRHFFFSMARRAEYDLRNRILDHAYALSTRFFSKTKTGEFMALATNDVESVRQAIAMGFVAGFDASVYAVVAVGAMLWLDHVLALWTILPLPFLALLMALSLRAIYERWDRVQASFETLTEKSRESISGMRVLRAYDREATDCGDFDVKNADYYRKYMRYVHINALFHPAVLLLAGSCVAILLGVGGARVLSGQTSMGSFVAFVSYLGMLTWPMVAAGWMLSLIQRAAASMDRINALLNIRDFEERSPGGSELPRVEGRIAARGLRFAYTPDGAPAVNGVSFDVGAGQSLGIVGEVGSGKSTIVQLLCRLYDPPREMLFVDGRDVRDIPVDVLRAAVAYVPQEAFLFSDTIAENLRLGEAAASREDLETVCRIAALHEEILEFPRGYETLLGERGITLSGGQKQRLCLARALLKKAPILVLDDTLSAVDAETESAILSGLGRIGRDRTTIVVSHRVSAVRDLDRILCLGRGRILQSGTHEELMAAEGYYRDIALLQEMEA
jgi:ATP-binding cassette subfamily B protein